MAGFYRGSGATTNVTAAISTTATVTVLQGPDLTVSKSASASTVSVGQPVTYTITVTNSGTATTNTFTLTDTLPSNFTSIQAPAGCTVSSNTVTCNNQTISTTPKTYTINATATTPGVTANTASVSGLAGETNTTNNTSAAANVTIQQSDLTVTKTASPTAVIAGQPVTFGVVVKNVGDAASGTYTLTDAVPSQFSSVQFSGTPPSGCSITGNTVTCTNQAALAVNATRTYTFTATPTIAGSLTNTATLSATSNEPTANNSGSTSVSVQAAESDLTVTKSASKTSGIVAGDTITYTVTVKNSGNTASSSYTLSDPVPSAFTGVAVSSPAGACTISGNSVQCPNQPGLAPGATRVFTITAKASSTTSGTHTNTATISATTGEASTTNNSGSVDVAFVAAAPKLEVTKTADRTVVRPGEQVTFTIVVKNTGNVDSNTYTLTDPVPSQFYGVESSTPGCTWVGNTVTCANQPALAAGASKAFTITAWNGASVGTVTNTATVTTTGQPSSGGSVDVGSQTNVYDLSVTKTAQPSTVSTGGTVTFKITVTNTGNAASSQYTVTDFVPAPFGTVASSDCPVTDKTFACSSQAPLAPGASKTYTITAVAGPNAAEYTNTVNVQGIDEANTANNTASVSGSVVSSSQQYWPGNSTDGDFTLTKTASVYTLPSGGGPVTYTYAIKNNTGGNQYLMNPPSDDLCRTSMVRGSGWSYDNILGKYYLSGGGTGTYTCTQNVTATVTNTATVQMADGWFLFGVVRLSTATAQSPSDCALLLRRRLQREAHDLGCQGQRDRVRIQPRRHRDQPYGEHGLVQLGYRHQPGRQVHGRRRRQRKPLGAPGL